MNCDGVLLNFYLLRVICINLDELGWTKMELNEFGWIKINLDELR